jgi:hypothetical protein
MNENCFYVYEHWRPDKNVCFYVGKGRNKRAWQLNAMRNRHHKSVTSKLISMGLAVDVRIIFSGLSSPAALALEIDRIAMYGLENLTNMTGGGEGMGLPSEEVRKKMSVAIRAAWANNPELRRNASESRKGRITSAETKEKLRITSTGRKHTPEAREKIRVARKLAGIPSHVRQAQIASITGKKRAPFKESTIIKMQVAAKIREQIKRSMKKDAA